MASDLKHLPILKIEGFDSLIEQARKFRAPEGVVRTAAVRTLNYGGNRGTTAARKALIDQTGIKRDQLSSRRGLTTYPARVSNPKFDLVAKSRWTPLGYFSPVQQASGVRAKPWNRTTLFPRLFLVRFASGYVGVFRRDRSAGRREFVSRVTGKKYSSQPLQERWGPSLAVELTRGRVPTEFFARASEAMATRLPHEIEFALSQTVARKAKMTSK